MATYTSGSLDSVKITGGTGDAYKTRYLTFSWKATSTSTGKTTISWDVHGKGGNTTYSTFSVKLNGTNVYSVNNEVVSYKSSEPLASGTKTYQHDSNGAATVSVEIIVTKIWTSISGNTTTTASWSLNTNHPYTACYWDTNATVSIDESLQKPDSNITIRWSGAKAGTANAIAGFEVYYSLNSGTSWTAVSTSIAGTSTSTTMTVPSNRGNTITAKVVIKNTQTSFTNPSKTGGSCKINSLPEAPSVLTSSTTIPSTQNTISFTVTAGTDADEQACSIKYATSSTGTKTDYTSGTNIDISGSTTYYFWTWDGYEWGSSTPITITKNTKPTVTLAATGSKLNRTLTATKGENGQSSNNSYRYGFKYNNTEYYLTSGFVNQLSCEVGDIRHWISKEISGLSQDTTYSYQYWVQRYDGIEYSNKAYLDSESFRTKVLTLDPRRNSNDSLAADLAEYFGTNITVGVTGQGDDGYYPTGSRSFSSIKRGEQLTSIDFKKDENSSQSFNIKIPSLTRVYAFDFFNLTTPNPFKPYSQSQMSVTMAGRDAKYGFSRVPQIKCGDSSESINGTVSTTDNQWNYLLPPDVVWNTIINDRANDATATFHKNLTVTNEFGENFTQENVKFYFDFRETPIFNDFSMFDENSYFIKEGSELTLNGTITYYNKTININIKDNGGKYTYVVAKTNSSFLGNPWSYNSDTGKWMCTGGHTYDLATIKKKQPVVTKQYITTFTVSATCVNKTSSKTTDRSITVIRHIPPRIRFTELEYSSATLSGRYIIDDLGYDSGYGGKITEIYMLGPDKEEDGKYKKYTIWQYDETKPNVQPEAGKGIEFTLSNYNSFTENFRELYPICTNYLLGSPKTTENFEYLIVYNVLPTIAYRQNHLGINTKDPSSAGNNRYLQNPTLTIGAYNQHKFIYLTSANKIASINLETSGLNGFVVDAGSWDEMDPIDVTHNPQDLQIIGLAPIAYTGEVKDLEQEENVPIIITGGGAPI